MKNPKLRLKGFAFDKVRCPDDGFAMRPLYFDRSQITDLSEDILQAIFNMPAGCRVSLVNNLLSDQFYQRFKKMTPEQKDRFILRHELRQE